MSCKLAIAVISSSLVLVSPAFAGQTISDKGYWPNEIAANRSTATSAGLLSSFAFEGMVADSMRVATPSKFDKPYQGGPHPR